MSGEVCAVMTVIELCARITLKIADFSKHLSVLSAGVSFQES